MFQIESEICLIYVINCKIYHALNLVLSLVQKHDMINPETTSLREALQTANELNKNGRYFMSSCILTLWNIHLKPVCVGLNIWLDTQVNMIFCLYVIILVWYAFCRFDMKNSTMAIAKIKEMLRSLLYDIPHYITMGYEKWYTSPYGTMWRNVCAWSSKSCQLHVDFVFDLVLTIYISH